MPRKEAKYSCTRTADLDDYRLRHGEINGRVYTDHFRAAVRFQRIPLVIVAASESRLEVR